jgi:NAD+ diphosphatase
MLGFLAPWTSGEPGGSDPELEDVRWFTRSEIAAAAELPESWDGDADDGQTVLLPPRLAIARRLVEHWLARQP